MATALSEDYRENLQNFKNPVLLIYGNEDLITTPEMGLEIFKSLPQAEWVLLSKRGHTLNLEAVPELVNTIKTFLSRQNN
jgi:3-oxoadipate enol-lactonase